MRLHPLARVRSMLRVSDDADGRTAESLDDLTARYEPPADPDGPHVVDPFGVDAGTVRSQVGADGQSPAEFVAGHEPVVDAVVDAAFERLDEQVDDDETAAAVERTRRDLSASLSAVLGNVRTGVEPLGWPLTDGGAAARRAGESFPLGAGAILDRIGTTLFVLDTEGNVVHWNAAAEELTGVSAAEARSVEMASEAFYRDGRRAKTLADKVLDAPERADEVHDVPRAEEYGFTCYRDRSTMTDADGEERHISFSASPLYDDDGDLVGVVEMVQDRTDDVRRRERTVDLVDEIRSTMAAIRNGDYEARAAFQHREVVEDDLVAVVAELNDLAETFEGLATTVTRQASELSATTTEVAHDSDEVVEMADEQKEAVRRVAREISNLSATIEEVASTASEVDTTSSQAASLAEDGQASAAEAVSDLESVAASADSVAADVNRLQDRIEEINDIVEVINDIAEQTNILALNASIEAARADAEGAGFAVVADEVKSLAEESQRQASEIEEMVTSIQEDTADTVGNLEETTTRITEVIDEVETSLENLEDIVAAVEETSQGIQEVADATDDQAASTEKVASMIDQAVDEAERISDAVGDISEATDDQRDAAERLQKAIQQHTF